MWPLSQGAASFTHALDFIHTLWVHCLLAGTMVSQSEHSLRMSFSCHSCHVLNSKTDPASSRHILQLVNGGGSLVTKSCLTLATQWTVARQDPLFMEFSRQENRSGCHFLLQGIFPTQGSKLHPRLHPCRWSPTLQAILYWLSHQTHKTLCPSCSVGDWLHNKISDPSLPSLTEKQASWLLFLLKSNVMCFWICAHGWVPRKCLRHSVNSGMVPETR